MPPPQRELERVRGGYTSLPRGAVLLLLLGQCLLQTHAFPGVVLPVQDLLLVDELGALRIHQFLAEVLILEQLQHVQTLRVPGSGPQANHQHGSDQKRPAVIQALTQKPWAAYQFSNTNSAHFGSTGFCVSCFCRSSQVSMKPHFQKWENFSSGRFNTAQDHTGTGKQRQTLGANSAILVVSKVRNMYTLEL